MDCSLDGLHPKVSISINKFPHSVSADPDLVHQSNGKTEILTVRLI